MALHIMDGVLWSMSTTVVNVNYRRRFFAADNQKTYGIHWVDRRSVPVKNVILGTH